MLEKIFKDSKDKGKPFEVLRQHKRFIEKSKPFKPFTLDPYTL